MKTWIMKRLGGVFSFSLAALVGVGLGVVLDPSVAMANSGLTGLGTNAGNQAKGALQIVGAIAQVAGAGFGLVGGMKLKNASDDRGQEGLKAPLFMLVAAAILIGLPQVLGVGLGTVFGSQVGVVNATASGGGLDSISVK